MVPRYSCALKTPDINMFTMPMLKCLCAQGLLFTIFTILALHIGILPLRFRPCVFVVCSLSAGSNKNYFYPQTNKDKNQIQLVLNTAE